MTLPKQVIEELNQAISRHVAPLEPVHPDHIAYVLIFGWKNPQDSYGRPRYHVIWVEISEKRYQSFLQGNDIGWDDAEYIEEEWANTPEELEQILAPRVQDFSRIVTTKLSKVPYPK